ncbi:hypothetical protein HK098_003920 [Nowakowskiella sp. JEL0407]|nr:hypothetical protein HK098_003920 [Nowakowskiella sp. JEL0407]
MQTVSVDANAISFSSKFPPNNNNEYPLHLYDPIISSANLPSAAAESLRAEKLVVFPTETVYGIGAIATSATAVSKIFIAKQRPQDNPLIVHISSLKMLEELFSNTVHPTQPNFTSCIPKIYFPLIAKYWPGPLTILIPAPPSIPSIVTAGHPTIAVRFPSSPIARALISLTGLPIAAPSANKSGRPSPTLASHVIHDFQNDLNTPIAMVIDGGPCESGVESTVIDALMKDGHTNPVILRPGGVTVEMVRMVVGFEGARVYKKGEELKLEEFPTTPGMKYRHYTPNAHVVLFDVGSIKIKNVESVKDKLKLAMEREYKEIVTAGIPDSGSPPKIGILRTFFSNTPPYLDSVEIYDLGTLNNYHDIANQLFRGLRELESRGVSYIFVEGITEDNEGLAVMNRIRKAASSVVLFLSDS